MTISRAEIPFVESEELLSIPCIVMRGGSSRGACIRRSDLPENRIRRDAVLLAAYGSPDSRQIDGIGGADPLTSKAALIDRSERNDADVEYTFCQVGVDTQEVSIGGNCGNMLAAVGPFAILTGLIQPMAPFTEIRVYVTNIDQVVKAIIPVADGVPLIEGTCEIAGVPDSGAPIVLDFGNCVGSVSGQIFPTGSSIDHVALDGRTIPVSLVDAATPFVFVAAEDVGAIGVEMPDQILHDTKVMDTMEAVRGWAAVKMGLASDPSTARNTSPNIPRVMMVAPSQGYTTMNGCTVDGSEVDIVVRQMAMQRPHRALAVTGAVCTAVASSLKETVPSRLVVNQDEQIRIGHPGGILNVRAETSRDPDGSTVVKSVTIERTARPLMSGLLYARSAKVEALCVALGRKNTNSNRTQDTRA